MEKILTNENLDIVFDKAERRIESNWKKFCLEYAEPLNEIVIWSPIHDLNTWLDDMTAFNVFFPAYTNHIKDHLLSLLEATPIKKAALIMPGYFVEAQLKGIEETFAGSKIVFRLFNNRSAGLEFLRKS